MNDKFDPFEEPRKPIAGRRSSPSKSANGRISSYFSKKSSFLAVMIALGVLIGAIWSLYPRGDNDGNAQNVPIVRADSKPMKLIPEDAGGMDIPNRDSTVFSALRPEGEQRPRIENLLAPDEDEEPLPRSQLFAGLDTQQEPDIDEKVSDVEKSAQEKVDALIAREQKDLESLRRVEALKKADAERLAQLEADAKEAAEQAEIEEKAKAMEAAKEKAAAKVKELDKVVTNALDDAPAANDVPKKLMLEPKPEIVAPPKVEPKVTPKAAPVKSQKNGTHYVQLVSVKNEAAAKAEWPKLRAKYKLGGEYRIQRKDLGAKGVFYRIQAGPYSKSNADKICADIKKQTPGGCLVAGK